MADSTRATSLYTPVLSYGSQSEFGFYSTSSQKPTVNPLVLRSLSREDVQKMKYKIELG